MRRHLYLLAALAAFSVNSNASMAIVEVQAADRAARTEVASLIHVDSIQDDRIFSIVHTRDLKALGKLKIAKLMGVELITEGKQSEIGTEANVLDFPAADSKFHNYDEMLDVLKGLEAGNPGLAHVFSMGRSVEGREIWAIKIGEGETAEDGTEKPAAIFMATHHAREHVSTEMPIMFAQELLNNYQTNPRIRDLLKEIDIYLVPMVNPDGAMYDIDAGNYRWWRKNRCRNSGSSYGVDLNRNYGFGWGTGGSSSSPSSDVYMGSAPFAEPETRAIRDFFLAHPNIKIALSLHTFSELILYPWGGRDEGVGGEDEKALVKMANDIAKINNYTPMQSSDLYIASGDTCDWVYGELSTFCFTFELSPSSLWGGGFYPGASVIDDVYRDNVEAMYYLMDYAADPARVLHN